MMLLLFSDRLQVASPAFTFSGTPHLVVHYATRLDPQYATTVTLP